MLTYSKELIFFLKIVCTTKALIMIAVETQHLVCMPHLKNCRSATDTDPFKCLKNVRSAFIEK